MIDHSNKTVRDILGRGSVHPFPARMALGIALDVVAGRKEPLRILDPMSGSGTVLAVARANGHHAVGVDMDPLAVLIAKVWTTPVDLTALKEAAAGVLNAARQTFGTLRTRDAHMGDSDLETRQFIRFWFDSRAQRQLTALATAIECVRDEKNPERAVVCLLASDHNQAVRCLACNGSVAQPAAQSLQACSIGAIP